MSEIFLLTKNHFSRLKDSISKATVTVIRECGDSLVYCRLDLTDPAIVSSPYYYLRQNDVVIVDPNAIRQANSRYNQNNSYKLSVISTIVSAVSVIASLVIALAVR